MTEAERIARANRAQAAQDEFLSPMFSALEEEYTARIIEHANTELHPANRSDKITALSLALKVVRTLNAGMAETLRDGELARADMLRAEKIEQMTDSAQRLLKIAGY